MSSQNKVAFLFEFHFSICYVMFHLDDVCSQITHKMSSLLNCVVQLVERLTVVLLIRGPQPPQYRDVL